MSVDEHSVSAVIGRVWCYNLNIRYESQETLAVEYSGNHDGDLSGCTASE